MPELGWSLSITVMLLSGYAAYWFGISKGLNNSAKGWGAVEFFIQFTLQIITLVLLGLQKPPELRVRTFVMTLVVMANAMTLWIIWNDPIRLGLIFIEPAWHVAL